MGRDLRIIAAVGALLTALAGTDAAFAQGGGILRMSHFANPASMSLHEEATAAANRPMMGVFNNLVMYQQDWRRRWSRAPGRLAPNSNVLSAPDLYTLYARA